MRARALLVLVSLGLAACVPSAPAEPQSVGGWTYLRDTNEQITPIRKMSLADGTDCYGSYTALSCLKRGRP